MILYAFQPHHTETAPAWNGAALRSWRWTIVADWQSFGLHEQVRHDGEPWHSSHCLGYYIAGYSTRDCRVCMVHDYYDGPHHTLWLGPLWFSWRPLHWCTLCMPDPEEDTSGAVQAFIEAVLVAALTGGDS